MSFPPQLPGALPFDLTICGLEELDDHSQRDVSHVVSILDPLHPEPPAFQSYGVHERLELRFHDIIRESADYHRPEAHHVEAILRFGREIVSGSGSCRHLLIHCHAGISRSTAAMTLFLAQAQPELSAWEILTQVVKIRAKAWPNIWMLHMGEELLERPGEFTTAVAGVYRDQLQLYPHLGEFLTRCGRGREVALGLGESFHPAA